MLMEMQYSENVLIQAEVFDEDRSFGHEFGTEKVIVPGYHEFRVMLSLGGNQDYDITEIVTETDMKTIRLVFDRFLLENYETA